MAIEQALFPVPSLGTLVGGDTVVGEELRKNYQAQIDADNRRQDICIAIEMLRVSLNTPLRGAGTATGLTVFQEKKIKESCRALLHLL